ncbi:hypothetical protein F4802DRAFT_600504 [Xylaria palmicola]|nr:hypothetical protein F4802DRAFT_600504 [Xylaria palmicola]
MEISYTLWQCGHVTRNKDGNIVSENGDLTKWPLNVADRDRIRTNLGDICPRCCTQRLRERLQDIKTLLTHCNCEHEAVRTAKRRLMAMSAFLSRNSGPVLPSDDGGFSTHPAEIAGIVSGVDELGDAVFDAALADFAAARAMMRPAAEPRLLQPIGRIREDALRWSAYGDKAVKKCAAEIVREADLMIKDIESDQKAEAQLAVALEAESRKLKMALASRAQENKRYREALEKPNF